MHWSKTSLPEWTGQVEYWVFKSTMSCYMLMSAYLHAESYTPSGKKTSLSLIPQLDTVITELSAVKGLSLRGNTLRIYRAKHLPLISWTYGDTGLYIGYTSYISMKVLVFAKNENIQFFLKPLLI